MLYRPTVRGCPTVRGSRPRPRASFLIVLALAGCGVLSLGGCGSDDEVVFIEDDGPVVIANLLTQVEIASVTLNQGRVEVCFRLIDGNSDLVRIIPEFSLDGGTTYAIATEDPVPPSGGTANLTSSPGGDVHCFVWDPGADGIGVSTMENVLFRVTPNDGTDVGIPAVSDPFVVFNPAVVVNIGTTTALFGSLDNQVPVELETNGTNPVSVTVEVTFDHTVILPSAMPAATGPQANAVGGVISQVDTSIDGRILVTVSAPAAMSDGVIAFLAFDALVPAVQTQTSTPLTCVSVAATSIALTPINAVCGLNGEIFLTPNLPPSCSIDSMLMGMTFFTGVFQVDYTLFDAEGDIVDVTPEYSTDGGLTWSAATELMGMPSEGTTGLSASPGGDAHVFVWDAQTDIPTLTMTPENVTFRIVAADVTSGSPCIEGPFTVDLRNAPPTCSPDPLINMGMSGTISFTFDVDDLEMDMVDVVFEYSTGGPFMPATPAGTSPLMNPALSNPTPSVGLRFDWDSTADVGAVMATATFRVVVGDATTTVVPVVNPNANVCDTATINIDNTARVFNSLVVLGPGSMLGAGPNNVGGGYTPGDPCSINDPGNNFTFLLGPNSGELTQGVSYLMGNNPLVFSDDGQTAQLVVQGNFGGVGAAMADISSAMTADGDTTYAVNAGPGGPYTMVDANGLVTALLAGGGNGQSGCDTIDVTFTPNGMGMAGGSNGAPMTATFAACLDYYGYDLASRDNLGQMADGDWDMTMFGTPSGTAAPGAGGSASMIVAGKSAPMQDPSAFQFTMTFDPAVLMPDTTFGTMGTQVCAIPPVYPAWTAISNPTAGPNMWLVNGFRVVTPMMLGTSSTESICAVSYSQVSAGDTSITTLVEFWNDSATMDIVGSFATPYVGPAVSGGFTVP